VLRGLASEHLDLDRIVASAAEAWTGGEVATPIDRTETSPASPPVTIGYLSDRAFSFYYPENLEALEARGSTLVPLSSLAGDALPPDLDALYVGGGFPETHAATLAANRPLLDSVRAAAARGLPIYAECGGLMLLANTVAWQGRRHTMAGVFPIDVEVLAAPQGHGYVILTVDRPNPYFDVGLEIRAHEFHYSRIVGGVPESACAVLRGTGCGGGRDAMVVNRVWASYAHVHAAGLPAWADGVVRAAREYGHNAGGAS
jgi:cobyrinic acid a,c-diamide synthase